MRIHTTPGCGPRERRPTRRRHDFGHPHRGGHPLRTFAICVLAALAALACVAFDPAGGQASPAAVRADGAQAFKGS